MAALSVFRSQSFLPTLLLMQKKDFRSSRAAYNSTFQKEPEGFNMNSHR